MFGMAAGSFTAVGEAELTQRGVVGLRGAIGDRREMAALSAQALSSAATGELAAVIGQQVPLESAADAHRAIEARATIGKTLLVA